MTPWLDFFLTLAVAGVLLVVALGLGEMLERGGKSDPEDYSDDD